MTTLVDEPKTSTDGNDLPPIDTPPIDFGGAGDNDDIFQVFHKYKRVVRRGQVYKNLLLCPNEPCKSQEIERVTGFGTDDELVLNCPGCGATTIPGQEMIRSVRGVVEEWFVNDD